MPKPSFNQRQKNSANQSAVTRQFDLIKLDQRLQEGVDLHQLGKLAEAKHIYEAVLKVDPKKFAALHLLGTVEAQLGNFEAAVNLITKAIAVNPNHADSYSNLGNAFIELQQFDKALVNYDKSITIKPESPSSYFYQGIALLNLKKYNKALSSLDKAISLKPDFANAYFNRGNALIELKQIDAAIASYKKSISINPEQAQAHYLLGISQLELEQYNEALSSLGNAINVNPDFAAAYHSRGNVMIELKQVEAAIASYQKSISIDPDQAVVHYNLGVAQQSSAQYKDALSSFEKAISLNPDFVDAYSGRGLVLAELKRHAEAIASFDAAISINPQKAGLHLNRGNSLIALKRFEEGLCSFDRVIAIKPNSAEAFSNRGNVLLLHFNQPEAAMICFDVAIGIDPNLAIAHVNRAHAQNLLAQLDGSVNSYLKALEINSDVPFLIGKCIAHKMKLCDWRNLSEGLAICESMLANQILAVTPFEALNLFDNPELHLLSSMLTMKAHFRPNLELGNIPKRPAGSKLRIGFFSADLYYHPVSIWLAEQLENHDKSKFELFGFSFRSDIKDPMQARLQAAFDHYFEVGKMPDLEVVQLSRQLEIDIAIDLGGHTAESRTDIFASRAAPIQINHLGFPGTMAADYIDYFICDTYSVAEESRNYFTEKIAYVPCWYTYDRQRQISAQPMSRAQFGLPDRGFVFTCQNGCQKFMPELFGIWMGILNAVPESVLWLMEPHPTAMENLMQEAQARGVARDRLVFTKREVVTVDQEKTRVGRYLASYKLADLFLDTWPYNAGTTAVDALWAGLPVLTKAGKGLGARMAASALHAIELPELITSTDQEYQALAIALATDQQKLKLIKDKLQHNRLTTALFDPVVNTRHIEAAYIEMYKRYQAGQAPDDIFIQT